MKKILAVLLTFVLVFGVCAVSVSASEATDIKACRNKTDYADYFFSGLNVEYVINYVCGALIDENDPVYDNNTMTQTYAAAAVDEFIEHHFVLTDEMYAEVKEGLGYDKNRDVYVLPFHGGFGGFNKPREYVSYVKNSNNTYSLYYQTIDWQELPQAGYDQINAMEDYPSEFQYEGKTYESTQEGYYCKNGYLNNGLVHTLEVKDNVARYISTAEYTGSKVPVATKPENKEETKKEESQNNNSSEAEKPVETAPQTVTKTEGLVLQAVENTFDKDTVVKAEKIKETAETYKTVTTSLKEVATKFVAYEITATKKNVKVQPNGTVTATFDIPTDFDASKVTVYYVSDDGQYEELEATVDAVTRKVSATLKHFSTYVVAEKTAEENIDNTDLNVKEKSPVSPLLIVIIVLAVLVIGAVGVILYIKLKK